MVLLWPWHMIDTWPNVAPALCHHHKCVQVHVFVGSWLTRALHSVSQLVFTVHLPFCGPNRVHSFFCHLLLVIKLACTDTHSEVLMLSDSSLMAMCLVLFAGLLHGHPGHCAAAFLSGHGQGKGLPDCPHSRSNPLLWALHLHLCLAY